MTYAMMEHKVGNFEAWKGIFDKEDLVLRQGGCRRFGLYRDTEDPSLLVIFLEFDTRPNAKKFLESERLEQVMKQSGVEGKPAIHYLDLLEKKVLQPHDERAA